MASGLSLPLLAFLALLFLMMLFSSTLFSIALDEVLAQGKEEIIELAVFLLSLFKRLRLLS